MTASLSKHRIELNHFVDGFIWVFCVASVCELLINLLEKLIAAESIIFHNNFPKRPHIIWLTDRVREKKLTFCISIFTSSCWQTRRRSSPSGSPSASPSPPRSICSPTSPATLLVRALFLSSFFVFPGHQFVNSLVTCHKCSQVAGGLFREGVSGVRWISGL